MSTKKRNPIVGRENARRRREIEHGRSRPDRFSALPASDAASDPSNVWNKTPGLLALGTSTSVIAAYDNRSRIKRIRTLYERWQI